ncbi:MIP family Ig-specific serine endopeptidase [Mycoplasma capricolum]|uniref:MIP family Ig-specific serine endopeptidase n=1 Tax=Mycoplasma capricolum TaxID=2095 RepID=UPI003DA2D55B
MKRTIKYLSFLGLIPFLSITTISCVKQAKENNNKNQLISQFKQLIFILNDFDLDNKKLESKIIKAIEKSDFNKISNINLELTIKFLTRIKNELKTKTIDQLNKEDKLDILTKIKVHLASLNLIELVNIVDELVNKLNQKEEIKNTHKDKIEKNKDNIEDIDDSKLEILESKYIPNQHNYPDYVKNFKTVSTEEIYKELYDRTFSIKFLVKLKDGGLLSNGTGTGWLLDYHKYSNTNKYKMFIATNLHVLADFSNSLTDEQNKEFNYYDPSGNKVIGLGLGKADNVTDFSRKNNNWKSENNIANYYLNNQDFENYLRNDFWSVNKFSKGISEPKIVFGAVDFMKDRAIKNHYEALQKEAINYYNYKKNNNEINDDNKIAWNNFLDNKDIPIMIDFAVFEFDVDLDLVDYNLKSWISNAISGLDNYLDRLNKAPILPNQDKKISKYLQTTDYVSALFKKDKSEQNLYNAKDIYIAGYPTSQYSRSVWMQNNPIERNSSTLTSNWRSPTNDKTFAFANEVEEKAGTGLNFNIHDNYWHRVFATFYGYQYNINFSSLYYGASGSLAYNEFGQIIGIYNNVKSNVEFGDLLQSATIAPFLQSDNIKVGDNIIYAYNLIDGTDKTKYKYQKSSFRENLQKLYPNGFSDGLKSTKLFDDIFN